MKAKYVILLAGLAVLAGLSYGLFMDWKIRKVIHRADSLALVSDSLRTQSDSLLLASRRVDTLFISQVITKLVPKWDTVQIDSSYYVPIAQADSVMYQRDRCIVAWQACAVARDTLARSRDVFAEQTRELKERIARDSARAKGPHLDLAITAGPGVLYVPSEGLKAGFGTTAGIKLYNLRIF